MEGGVSLNMSKTAKTLSTEADIWKNIKGATDSLVHWTRVEARVGAGVPDINGGYAGLEFWVELKVCRTVRYATGGLWRPAQVAWQTKRCQIVPDTIWNVVSHPAGQRIHIYGADKVLSLNNGEDVPSDLSLQLPPNWFQFLDLVIACGLSDRSAKTDTIEAAKTDAVEAA
jgi:hypothetical protein